MSKIQANNFVNRDDTGAPDCSRGLTVSSGLLGIGVTNPQDALHIAVPSAVLRLEDTDTNHISTIQSTAAALVLSADATDTVASSYLALSVDGSERARIDSAGRLGLGITNPASRLVSRDTNESGIVTALAVENYVTGNPFSGNGAAIDFNLNNNGNAPGAMGRIAVVNTNYRSESAMQFYTGTGNALSALRMIIDSSGRLGVGTAAPTNTLEVAGTATSNLFAVKATSSGDVVAITARSAGNGGIISGLNNAQNDYEPLELNGEIIYFQTRTGAGTVTERARIDSSGRLLVGTTTLTSESAGRQILEINGTSSTLINLDTGGTRRAYLFTDATDTYLYNTQAGS